MPSRRQIGLILPERVRRLPADLVGVLVLALLTGLSLFVPVVRETPLRAVLTFPYLLFAPGYALIAALYPEAERDDAPNGDPSSRIVKFSSGSGAGITPIERITLSGATSIPLVVLIALVANFTPWGIRVVPVFVLSTLLIVALVGIAVRRRWRLPPERRFSVPLGERLERAHETLFRPATRRDELLNVMLALALLAAASGVGYALIVPQEGEQYTEFYLLSRNNEGELVADEYPQELTAGHRQPLVFGVQNNEHERIRYTVVIKLQRVQNNTTVETATLDRFSSTLTHGETWRQPHALTPRMTGEHLRLQYLLYRGSVPQTPTVENAYREVHLWVDVAPPGG